MRIDGSFVRKHKTGTVCGTVGNIALTDVADFIDKYIEFIEPEECNPEDLELDYNFYDKKLQIYSLPSSYVKFKNNLELTNVELEQLEVLYSNLAKDIYSDFEEGENFKEVYGDGSRYSTNYVYELLAEIFSFLISEKEGSFRNDSFEEDGVTAYFESE